METKMPKTNLVVQLTGEDGNVFNFCGIVTKILLKMDIENMLLSYPKDFGDKLVRMKL